LIVRVVACGDRAPRPIREWLTIGAEYVALSLEVSSPRGASVRVITDEGGRSAGVFALGDFEIIDGRLSSLWTVRQRNGQLSIEPTAWDEEFWTDFYMDWPGPKALTAMANDRRSAIELFDDAVREMHAEAGRVWRNAPPIASDIRAR